MDEVRLTDSRGTIAGVLGLSVLTLSLVAGLLYGLPAPQAAREPGALPTLNALLNAACAVTLLIGWRWARRGRYVAHQRAMLTAFAFSVAFFVGYVVHHARVGSVPFIGTGLLRVLYFSILIPHIVLAAAIVPMVLLTLHRGLTRRRESHRRLARWTAPAWLFVSVSGVVVYFMLYHL